MDIVLSEGISAVAIIILLVQVSKSLGMNTKYAPLLAIVLGVALSMGFSYFSGGGITFQAVILGIAVGASSVGLFSVTKNTREAVLK